MYNCVIHAEVAYWWYGGMLWQGTSAAGNLSKYCAIVLCNGNYTHGSHCEAKDQGCNSCIYILATNNMYKLRIYKIFMLKQSLSEIMLLVNIMLLLIYFLLNLVYYFI